ncbi:MAG: hypothetical protein U5R06_09320 [candidate division KSB1 bacterium]|nr:hypothetical protein [candidate division KSB1 bacterium]
MIAPEFAKAFDINVPGALNTQLNVKFVNTGIVHEAFWEGSCRWGSKEFLTPEAEKQRLNQMLQEFKQKLANMQIPADFNFLTPVTMYAWVEKGKPEITLPEEQLNIVREDADESDVYVVTHPPEGVWIAEAFKKPVIILQEQGWGVDMVPRIRMKGISSYQAHNWDELFIKLRLFAVKKAVAHTKLLNITNLPDKMVYGVNSGMIDLEPLNERYGMDHEYMDYQAFFGRMDELKRDKRVRKQVKKAAQELLNGAQDSNMDLEAVEDSLMFYYTSLDRLQATGSNAFTIECFELCSTLEPWKRRFTPCLNNALLKDSGIPAACEGDINALMAMMMQLYLSRKAVYMGNPNFDFETNMLNLHHSVASLKMMGLDSGKSPYSIHSFTHSKFGVTLRHDFTKDIGKYVTLGRFDPQGKSMLMTRGEITGGGGMTGYGCSQNVDIAIPNAYEFWRESQNYGHHLAMVYGDYVEAVRDLGDLMGFQVARIV